MDQDMLLLIINNSSLQTLHITSGKNPSIINSSQEHPCFDLDSTLTAFDKSIDEIIPNPDSKMNYVALVLPFSWIDSDGKINKTKNQLISNLCQQHSIKPVGFISSDEAILDYFNKEQGVPSSPVLINIEEDRLTVSLTDMGIIRKRLSCDFDSQESLPLVSENVITKLKDDFSITPKIFIWGQFSRQTVLDFNNHLWVDKDKADIFLHFPDITFLQQSQVLQIFLETINSQLIDANSFDVPHQSDQDNSKPALDIFDTDDQDDQDDQDNTNIASEKLELDDFTADQTKNEPDLPIKVDASELGFSNSITPYTPDQSITQTALFNTSQDTPSVNQDSQFPKEPKHKLKFKIPSLNLHLKSIWMYVLPVFIIVVPTLIFIFFYKVDIDIFITPLDLDLKTQVSLDDQIPKSLFDQDILAVIPQSNTSIIEDEVRTTGTKTVGERAQGKVIVFNKTDTPISINKGQILKTDSGISFEFQNDLEVEASSVDLDQGLISMGKTITVVSATDIGAQANILQNTNLLLADFSDSDIIAKAEESFAGGSSRQIQSVSEEDVVILTDRINQKISQTLSQNQTDQNNKYILPSTKKIKQSDIELSREIGEEADILSATLETTTNFYSLIAQEEAEIVKYISTKNNFNSEIDENNSSLYFDFVEINDSSGNLYMTGKASPKIDIDSLRQQLLLKNSKRFIEILKSNIQRAYDFNLRSNSPLGVLPVLPIINQNINLVIKTE